jgi:hypothetical protein
VEDSHSDQGRSDQDEKRSRRDLLLALLLLFLGLICLCCTAELAVRSPQTWQVSANMLAEITLVADGGQAVRVAPVGTRALTPFPENLLTPQGTPSPAPPGVIGELPTTTPTRQVAVVPTAAATDTPVPPPPTNTATSAPPPTATFTPSPTSTPTPTFTPFPTFTFTPIPTSTSEPPTDTPGPTYTPTATPTDTPTPTATDTPTPTPTPTNTPITGPLVLSITPNSGYNDAPVSVVIGGLNFMATPTVYLGAYPLVGVTFVDPNTLNATVPAGLAPGVYSLTVTNPDLQSDTLPAAYTVLAPVDPTTTLANAQLLTAGSDVGLTHGDDDHVQVIFFEVPDSYVGELWFRVYDADTGGGGGDEAVQGLDQRWIASWNTSMRYTLYGGSGAYTGAQASHPAPAQITSGTQLNQIVIGADNAYHDNWNLSFGPFTDSDGEQVGSSWVFKLVVEGLSGDNGNVYQAVVSTNNGGTIDPPPGSRIFAYCWTFSFTTAPPQPPFYPHLPAGTTTFTQYNLDFDDNGSGSMTLHTPLQDISVPASGISGVGGPASSSHPIGAGEDGITWTVDLDIHSPFGRNNGSFWATWDDWISEVDLAIFTQPTASPAP